MRRIVASMIAARIASGVARRLTVPISVHSTVVLRRREA
jgi:hypothetical protein